MTTDNTNQNIDETNKETDETPEVKFTQADMDKAVKSRLTREAEKTDAIQTELNELKEQLEAQPDVDEIDTVEKQQDDDEEKLALQYEIDELKKQHATERLDNAVKLELTKANARNFKAVQALLDTDAIEVQEDGSFEGITEAIEALKESDGYLFEEEKGTQGKATASGNPGRKNSDKPNAFDTVFGRYK